MLKILSKVQEMERAGRNIVHFELGEPDFNTPPHIVERACRALREGKTHYSNSMGIYELRQSIARHIEKTRGFLPSLDQVLVTPSANVIVTYAVSCLLDPGDEMIVQDPCFPTYLGVSNFFGVKTVPVPLKEANGLRLDPGDVRRAITPKTRLILVNSPSNPTGRSSGRRRSKPSTGWRRNTTSTSFRTRFTAGWSTAGRGSFLPRFTMPVGSA